MQNSAHPRVMLQIGVILFLLFLAVGLALKLKEWFGWNRTICALKEHLFDRPPHTDPENTHTRVLSILFTRNHGPVSEVIYWCTGRQFTHAALGLGKQTGTFYSFGVKGFHAGSPAIAGFTAGIERACVRLLSRNYSSARWLKLSPS